MFHGVIAATTPTGSRSVNVVKPGRDAGTVAPLCVSARPAKKRQSPATAAMPGRISAISLPVPEDLLAHQGFGVALDQVGEAQQAARSLGRESPRPAAVGEGADRRLHRGVDIGRSSVGAGIATGIGHPAGLRTTTDRPLGQTIVRGR